MTILLFALDNKIKNPFLLNIFLKKKEEEEMERKEIDQTGWFIFRKYKHDPYVELIFLPRNIKLN